jgi:moderate conductance mechanosensitive channel
VFWLISSAPSSSLADLSGTGSGTGIGTGFGTGFGTRSGTRSGIAADDPGSLGDAQESAADAAGWIEANWSTWVSIGLRVLLIAVIAILLRFVIRRSISKLIKRVNRRGEAQDSANALRGLLVSGERRRQRSEAIGSVLRNIASFVIVGTALLMVLSDLGINLAPLLASAGVAGVALGFGARDIVTDLLAGIFMLLEDQYGVGDRVDVGEISGTVMEIGLRVTHLRGDGGEIWYIRNGEIKRVGNLSQGWATATVDVQVRSSENLDEVRSALTAAGDELAKSEPWDEMLWEPVEVLGLDSVTLDSMVVRVSAKTMPGKSLGVERELRWRIKRTLDRRGIESVDDESLALEAVRAQSGTDHVASADGTDSRAVPLQKAQKK